MLLLARYARCAAISTALVPQNATGLAQTFFFVSVDIDECTNSSYCGDKTATCNNTIGSHECICGKGYKYDNEKRHCSDINECHPNGPCVNNLECKNTEGSYQCICLSGYRKEGNECKGGCFIFISF